MVVVCECEYMGGVSIRHVLRRSPTQSFDHVLMVGEDEQLAAERVVEKGTHVLDHCLDLISVCSWVKSVYVLVY